ncbi:MAG: hypothetical protein H0T60_01555 [Acidobacteria bacterium]|nr:hypothetical protein [Acidobacteriota bacterium]
MGFAFTALTAGIFDAFSSPGTTPPGAASSTRGLGEAMTCCSCAGVPAGVVTIEASGASAGSVAPPADVQALQPPTRARALKPFSLSICAARALVCSLGQEQ